MRSVVAIVLAAALAPLWVPMFLVRIAWGFARAMDEDFARWIDP